MDEQMLCRKRLLDLSEQSYRKGYVCFSDFLNLNELNIYHTIIREFPVATEAFGGYDGAERQMIAFIPDALFEYEYPIRCIRIVPAYPKFAEKLTHRDLLGAFMNQGIERNRLGDMICKGDEYFIFCEEEICGFLLENVSQIKHTQVKAEIYDLSNGMEQVMPEFEEREETVASNRIDAIIAKVYHYSRSEAANVLAEEKVFLNGKMVSNCNASCENGTIVSVRGKGRFVFETANLLSKSGKLKINIKIFK